MPPISFAARIIGLGLAIGIGCFAVLSLGWTLA